MSEERRWLRVSEAAVYLTVGIATLNKLRIYGGGPPFAKLGRSVVYDVEDLDAWVIERKQLRTPQRLRAVK